ncbi:cation:proton antiporter [Flavihumibacter solisilvae]|uniref:Cation/H+ exchanger transmembrane domain-containing protein n=1 Tax=Flavihumibacter solisilvae TaxID=1349421 RepID=A0A0C1L4J5_9BACT|nr:cation:proton antiporter [Flavihumibacter solisilvae]KIC95027.1 hypothetical protein OI18_09095 [Flavihumibacter solisilvae]
MHDILLAVSIMCLVILLLIFLLRRFNQPYLIAYIIAGIILGPHVTVVFSSATDTAALGEIGIVLLMFFLGIEINVPDKRHDLRVPVIAQVIKTLLAFSVALLVGMSFGWGSANILLLTILVVFNSTAVVSEFLRRNRELYTSTGKTILNILVLQDIMIGPVLTVFQFMGEKQLDIWRILAAIAGCVVIFLLLRAVRNRNLVQLLSHIGQDHELQVFAGAFICLGFAGLAHASGLTPGIGSFVAGVYISRTHAFHWLERTLHPFKVFFVALFFVSVGLSLDLSHIRSNYQAILLITVLVIVMNSLLSALVFKVLDFTWAESLHMGALLSQTGEFGIIACSLAYQLNLIDYNLYKGALAVTGLTLLCSTVWMAVVKRFINRRTVVTKNVAQ